MYHPEYQSASAQHPPSEVRSCLQKVRYESFEEASVAAERARVTYGAIQHAYWCEWCWGYHNATVERRRF